MKKWRYAIGIVVLGIVMVWAYATLNYLDPNVRAGKSLVVLDNVVFAAASVLKVLTLAAIAWGLGRVFRHLQGNRGRALRGIIVWSLTGIALLAVLTAFRPQLAGLPDKSNTYFFPTEYDFRLPVEGYQLFVQRWHSGQIFAREAAFAIACSALLGLTGLWIGRLKTWSGAAALVGLGVIALFGGMGLGLFFLDYDNFLGGTMFGPMAVEAMIPFAAVSPTVQIGFLVFLALILASYALDRRWTRAEQLAAALPPKDQHLQAMPAGNAAP
jgi:hypothetical protein